MLSESIAKLVQYGVCLLYTSYQMVTDLFTSKAAEEFFRTEELLQLLKDHKDKKADNSRKIWTVLTFLIWYDRFFATCSKGELVTRLQ